MSYSCEICKYETDIKSNYTKHLQSKKHNTLFVAIVEPGIAGDGNVRPDKKDEFLCDSCGSKFAHYASLYKHKKSRCRNNKNNENENLKVIVNNLQNELNKLNSEIKEIKESKQQPSTTVNISNISVKNNINYIKSLYSGAPPLTQLNDYSLIDDEGKLLKDIIYNMNHKSLDKYLGDILVKFYKKDDACQQSIWSSDVARITYLIKELLANNKSLWNYDYKGIKTKEYIIQPLLDNIDKYIRDHLGNYVFESNLSSKQYEKIATDHFALGQALQYIETSLGDDLIKYLAPHFQINKINSNLLIELEKD